MIFTRNRRATIRRFKNKSMILIDFFSGYGGFHLGLEQAGFKFSKTYFSEIDKHAIASYRYNFPKSEYLGAVENVRNVKADLITFGFPCQDISLAGKRAGLAGKRSGLFYQATRALRESGAKCFIWENVVGLLSSNGGNDIEAVCEEIYLSGYIFDIAEINTVWWLPQNRLRLYSVGHSIKCLLECISKQDTQHPNYSLFVKIMEGCLLKKLQNTLTEPTKEYSQKQRELALGYLKNQEEQEFRGVKLRMKFLKIISTLPLQTLKNLYQIALQTRSNQDDITANGLEIQNLHPTDIKSAEEPESTERRKCISFIEMRLRQTSDENLLEMNKCIISTLINSTTPSRIYTYAEIQLNIDVFIIQLSLLYQNSWNEALSNLTAKKKNTSYAKSRRNEIGDAEENGNNAVRLSNGDAVPTELVGTLGETSGCEIFPIGESDGRNFEAQGEAQGEGERLRSNHSRSLSARYGKDGAECLIRHRSDRPDRAGHIVPTIRNSASDGGLGVSTGLYNVGSSIRRLTPTECERLQGLPDGWTKYGMLPDKMLTGLFNKKEISDTQRYKLCGNGVSIPPVKAIGEKLLKLL